MSKSQRTKGHAFEREIARELRTVFPEARRHLEYQDGEAYGVDIANTGDYAIQCKRWKDYAPVSAIEEIKPYGWCGIPILITKADNKPAMAVLPWAELLALIARDEEQ